MNDQIQTEDKVMLCRNCITGVTQHLTFRGDALTRMDEVSMNSDDLPFIAPGLIDLQINGINGIDFNNPELTVQDINNATSYLLSIGITSFLPTVITNSDDAIEKILQTIHEACLHDPMVNNCVYGIHLEGPFISPVAGAKGAHDEKFIKAPDWNLFERFQRAAGGKIRLITIAPEWEGSDPFIEKCRNHGILVAIGHSIANSEQVRMAVRSGASLSTHLGNGVPLLMQRHPNIIWDQLAADELYACIITDGIHIPDAFIKVVMKTKGNATIVVSDATCFAGMTPGTYTTHIGGEVILDSEKRLSLKSTPGLLAGAATSLLENVVVLINKNIANLSEAWQMASVNVANMLLKNDADFDYKNDLVMFRVVENEIMIERVIKNGKIVYEKEFF